MNFSITGVDRVAANIEKLLREKERKAEKVLAKWAERLKLSAQRKAPVDTGQLRDSITFTIDGTTATVYTDVDYAVYVEFGTSRMGGRYFMSNALVEVREQFMKELKEAIA